MERERYLAEEKYRMIFENSAVAITITDEQERLISWNKFTENLLGMDEEDLRLRPTTALRINLIGISVVRSASQGKEEKLEVIYEYLTGIEFKHRVEAIVEAFVNMQSDLDKERIAVERSWSKRGKQIQTVLQNFAGMYGDIEAIVGKALPRIKQLELPTSSN